MHTFVVITSASSDKKGVVQQVVFNKRSSQERNGFFKQGASLWNLNCSHRSSFRETKQLSWKYTEVESARTGIAVRYTLCGSVQCLLPVGMEKKNYKPIFLEIQLWMKQKQTAPRAREARRLRTTATNFCVHFFPGSQIFKLSSQWTAFMHILQLAFWQLSALRHKEHPNILVERYT